MSDTINYGRMMHKAMRRLIAEVLEQVAQNGLPGAHHFFISFDTSHPGVDMPEHLRQRYPDEMTIVMQEWFEDLAVATDRFSITLSFGGVPQQMVIPFDAIKTFVDPSVEFGLRFDAQEDGLEDDEDEAASAPGAEDGEKENHDAEIVSLDKFRKH
jgi:uncharacterized protein